MPQRVSPSEIAHWVELFESGQSISSIAKATKKDPRTVQNNVEAALRQRDVKAAHRRLVEDALRQHQEDLMGVVREVAAALDPLRPQIYLAIGLEEIGTMGIGPPLLVRGASGFESLRLAVEDRRTWALLEEHLRTDQLWPRFSKWKRASLATMNVGLRFLGTIRQRAEEATGLQIEAAPGLEPCLLPAYPWLLFQSVLPARQATEEPLLEAEAVSIGAHGTLRYDGGGYSLELARVPGKEEEVKATMRALLKGIPDWPEAVAFREARETVEIPTRELRRTLEEIQLTHYIAGKCKVCRRLGV